MCYKKVTTDLLIAPFIFWKMLILDDYWKIVSEGLKEKETIQTELWNIEEVTKTKVKL